VVGHVQDISDPVLQSDVSHPATLTAAAHLGIHYVVLDVDETHHTSVLSLRRVDVRVQHLLDHLANLVGRRNVASHHRGDRWFSRSQMVSNSRLDHLADHRLLVGRGLGNRHLVMRDQDGADTLQLEQPFRQQRTLGCLLAIEVA